MKPEMDSTNREMSQKVKLYFAVHHASRMKIRERESGMVEISKDTSRAIL